MGIKRKGLIRVKEMKHANDNDAPQYNIDPTRWMTRKERQLWIRLPDKKQQDYIEKAQSKVLSHNRGYGQVENTISEDLKSEEQKKGQRELQKNNLRKNDLNQDIHNRLSSRKQEQAGLQNNRSNQKNDELKQEIHSDMNTNTGVRADARKSSAIQESIDRPDPKPNVKPKPKQNSSMPFTQNKVGESTSQRAVRTSGKKVANKTAEAATMAVPAGKVVTVAKEVTKEVGKMLSYSARSEELRDKQQREDAIAETVAEDFSKDTKGLVNTIRTLSIIAIAQVQLIMTLMFPAIIAIVIVLTLIFNFMTFFAGIIEEEENQMSAQHIVQVALAEEELGEDITKGGQKYWSYMGFSSRVSWCASFVSWCGNECGYIESGVMPKSASVQVYMDWYKAKGLFRLKGEYTPKAGDLIIFKSAGASHIGIVQYVEGNRVVTVEGNTSDMVHTRSYALSNATITGYCTPEYPNESDFSGSTNAEIVWNFLRSKGCSEAAAAGIMGNLQQESGMDPTLYQSGGPGRGLCQWEEGSDRFENLKSMASSMGKEWTDIEPQLEFLWYELSGGEATCKYILNRDYGGFNNFINTTDVRWATLAFEKSYERAGTPMMANRYRYAESYYNQFAGSS